MKTLKQLLLEITLALTLLSPMAQAEDSLITIEPELQVTPLRIVEQNPNGSYRAELGTMDPTTHEMSFDSTGAIRQVDVIIEAHHYSDIGMQLGIGVLLVTKKGSDFDSNRGIMLRLGGTKKGPYGSIGYGTVGFFGGGIDLEYLHDLSTGHTEPTVGAIAHFQWFFAQLSAGLRYNFTQHNAPDVFAGFGIVVPAALFEGLVK